jgi:diguanylate cyclase (GGDEF)-like protein
MTMLRIDADKIPSYNKRGHQESDECLKQVSHLLHTTARRSGDVAARYGEEFIAQLPHTSAEGAALREDLRKRVKHLGIVHCRSAGGVVTASIGIACEVPGTGVDLALVTKADAALSAAKQTGRNRFARCSSTTQSMAAHRYGE